MNILITGTVMNADSNSTKVYKDIIDICKEISSNISSPLDTIKFNGSDFERYKRAMELLRNTHILIAEMSTPSTGQGMELQEAVRLSIPIIVIAKEGSNVSGLLKGSGMVKEVIYYEDIIDIKDQLLNRIKEENNEGTNCKY